MRRHRRSGALRLGVAVVWAVGLLWAAPAAAEEELRIALASRQSSVELGGRGLAIFDGESGTRVLFFDGEGRASLVARKGGLRIESSPEARIRDHRRVYVEADGAVQVGKGVYFGRIEVGPDPKAKDKLLVLNRLPLETYLLGIVGSEMSPAWPIEALKAQAVAARTYAMQRRAMMRAGNRPYDLASSVISQVYKGAERIRPSVVRAVKETRGEVMSYRHDLVEALFHSTCGGETVSSRVAFGGAVPYLGEQPCDWCKDSGRYRWEVKMPLKSFAKSLRGRGLVSGWIQSVHRGPKDERLEVRTQKGRKRLRPRDVRRAVGFGRLYSERFTARARGGEVVFSGRGFGHGVGLCQWGARGQALESRSYRQILGHYYPGIRIKRLY